MVEYDDESLFLTDGIGKQLKITYDDGEITNAELKSEDFTLTEKLTSNGTMVLGECNAGIIEFNVGYGTEPLEGKELTVTITPTGGDEFQIGVFTVVSDKPTADRRWRKITAYDAIYSVLNLDVTEWYDTILPAPEEGEDPTVITIKDFRDSFFEEVGITQEETDLPNDDVEITRTAEFTQLSGKTVLNAICEINGCFGHVDRTGTFVYVFPKSPSEALYPAQTLFPADNLYPKYAGGTPIEIGQNGRYVSAKYEDYFVTPLTAVQIRNDKNDVGVTVGSGDVYVVEGNFLAFSMDEDDLEDVANNILDKIKETYYCPADIVAQGNPCLEVGDPIILETRYARIETIIFQRKLKGIQALTDSYSSKGAKENKKNLNSLQSQIQQTQGKINEVKADLVTATKAIIDDLEANYATIDTLEANYATITSLQTVDGKIDNLTAIAITTQNLSTQNLSANQINAGTLSVNYLDVNGIVNALTARSITVSGLSVTGNAQLGGYMTYWVYNEDMNQYVLCGSNE